MTQDSEPQKVDIVLDRGGTGFRITDIFAFVSVHADGDEGIIGRTMMPLVAADLTRLQALRPYAQQAARASGKPVKLIRLTQRTELETFEP